MTRKLFQVSRITMIGVVLFVCLNLLLDKKVMLVDKNIYGRCVWLIISLIVFLLASVLYEKKRNIFSVGYLFIMVNVFVNGVIFLCYFTDSRLLAMVRPGGSEPQDFFKLYLVIYFIIMALILAYLACAKTTSKEIEKKEFIRFNQKDDLSVFIMGILVFVLNFKLGTTGQVLFVPILCYWFIRFVFTDYKVNMYTALGALAALLCLYQIRTNRYLIVAYALPIILIFCIFAGVNDNKKRGKKVVPILILGVVAVMAYGMVSEMVKLNLYYERNYNILNEIRNLKSIYDSCVRQVYRLFGIWTELGGNIIQHVKVHGYYHGITYFKGFSGIFGFKYVSLPLVSAKYISAEYAQPGLIAEGYANFGIAGAVINMLIPFAIAEGSMEWFLKKRTPLAICILTVPYAKILLDGGTINNMIFGIATCIFAFSLNIILHFAHANLVPAGDNNIRFFAKKRLEESE